ncbi:choice-of-anchor Q domain-containing protein [Chloroflexota bacterium]
MMMVQARKSISVVITLVLAFSLALTATLSLSQPVNATEFHVTTAAEFQDALTQAETNNTDDTIYLAAGTYIGNFQYYPQDEWPLTIRGELGTTAEDIILDGDDTGTVLRLDSSTSGVDYTVRGITLRNRYYGGLLCLCNSGESIDLYVSSVIIEENSDNTYGGGIQLDVNQSGGSINAEIYDSIIRNNNTVYRGGGIWASSYYGESSIELLLVNCLIYGNQAGWTGGGIDLLAGEVGDNNTTDVTILNCTITDNSLTNAEPNSGLGAGINAWAYQGNGAHVTLDLYNTILYGNTLPGEQVQDLSFGQLAPGHVTINAYSCDIGNVLGTPIDNSDNLIIADPAFVNPSSGDYHLTAGSPCVDSSTASVPDPPGLPPADIEGNLRVMGTAPDMGAYEYTGSPPEPSIGYSPNMLNFVATEGGLNPPAQTLDIWNSGAGTLDWSVSDSLWLDLSPPNGTSTGETDMVTVSVDTSGMVVGDYDTKITISDPLAFNTPQTVPVHLTINPLLPAVDEPSAADAFASIAPFLETAYGFKTGEGSGGWTVYNPLWPSQVNTLTTLHVSRGYWINVSEACILQYGSTVIVLDQPGWWLIGWIPQL